MWMTCKSLHLALAFSFGVLILAYLPCSCLERTQSGISLDHNQINSESPRDNPQREAKMVSPSSTTVDKSDSPRFKRRLLVEGQYDQPYHAPSVRTGEDGSISMERGRVVTMYFNGAKIWSCSLPSPARDERGGVVDFRVLDKDQVICSGADGWLTYICQGRIKWHIKAAPGPLAFSLRKIVIGDPMHSRVVVLDWTGKRLAEFAVQELTCISQFRSDEVVYAGDRRGNVWILDTRTSNVEKIHTFDDLPLQVWCGPNGVSSLDLDDSDDSAVALCFTGHSNPLLSVRHIGANGQVTKLLESEEPVSAAIGDSDGGALAVSQDGRVVHVDKVGRMLWKRNLSLQQGEFVTSAPILLDRQFVLVGTNKCQLHVVSLDLGHASSVELPHSTNVDPLNPVGPPEVVGVSAIGSKAICLLRDGSICEVEVIAK